MRNLARDIGLHISSPELTEVDIETLVAYGFDRYFETSGLFGTPETCIEIVNRLKAIQVDEIGCLIDFGVDFDSVFSSLQYLYKLKQQCERQTEMVLQDDSLDAQILKYNVSHVQCTPSLARVLATSSKSSNALQILKKLLLGGEALPPALVETLRQEMPGELHNMYGPTETTIWSTTSALGNSGDKVSIGRPIRNTQVYILDSHYQPVPIGVPGELFIAGSGVARGYLHSPELTAEKFVPAPFSRTPGERMYRTGDLARYLPDGTIDFLGRIDHQVKLRGFRIELREIESTLELHPTVREAIVLVREDIPGDKRLVAYLTLNNAHGFSITILSDFIHAKLPGYMIPSAFVILDALPLTPNGKVDRGKLPQPDKTNLLLETAHMPPRTFEENILVELWTDLLGVERIGIFDNFFKVGGDSLSAMQLISRIRATFKVGLSLRTFFEAPTIAGLADQIKVLGQRPEISGLVPALSLLDRNYSPLSYPQQRYWIVDRLEPGNPGSNVTFAVQLKGNLNVSALEQSLKEIIKRHEALRTTFVQAGDRIVQFISKGPALDLLMIDLSQFMEAEREAQARSLCTEESLYHFSLEAGPLIRASLLRLTSQEHVLVLNMHHIITDGWSNDIFIWEMKVLYSAISAGELPLLPELPIQYRDFALWQNRQNDILEARLSYWVKQLEDAPAGIEWPHRSANQVNLVNRAAKQRLTFSTTFTEQLKALSQQENVTLFITLLSVFSVLLYDYSNQEDIVIGAPVANRTWSEVEGLIGLFVNTLVLRINVTGDPSFQELLRRVRKVSLDAYSHADVPFEQVLKALHPETSLKRHPLYQILFVSENVPARNSEPSGLSVCDFSFDSGATIYDMVFSIQEVKQGLICSIEYNTSLFDAATIAQLCRRFSSLTEAIVANPQQHLSDLFGLLISDAAPNRYGETSSNDALL